MNKNYCPGFKLVYKDPSYVTINNDDADLYISIDINHYSTNITIEKGLSKLLTDLLNTPVNQRNKPEIKHTIKPATKEIVNTANLTSADEIIAEINNFIIKEFKLCPNRTLFITTNYNKDDLLQILSLFKDFDITIDPVPSYHGYILSIKAK